MFLASVNLGKDLESVSVIVYPQADSVTPTDRVIMGDCGWRGGSVA
jgi:hypothetical protein